MTTGKRGLSALLLQRQLALRRYETAWMMLDKFRRAMVNLAREPLRGEVEVDDTWIGGAEAGLRGSRQLKGRKAALVLVAVEKRGQATGRARMVVIPDFKSLTLLAFLKQKVSPGSTIYTRSKELRRIKGSWIRARAAYATFARRPAQRCEVRRPFGRPRHWQPAAMADRNPSRRESRSAAGLSRQVCLSAQSPQAPHGCIPDPAWPRNRP
jgi:transposase-like protein